MKVAVLIRRYIVTAGAERYAVEVARRLARRHEVHIFAQEWDHEPEGITLHKVSRPFPKPRVLNQWWYSWRTSRLTGACDVVYSHERATCFDVMNLHVGTFVGGLWGRPGGEHKSRFRTWLKVLTGPGIWAYLRLEKLQCRVAPGRFWIADSDMVKQEVQEYYDIPDNRFLIAHSGVDAPTPNIPKIRQEWRAKLGFGPDEPVALFVGSEFRRKGLGNLIEAMGLLRGIPLRLVVVGGQDPTSYQRQASDLKIADRITWAGRVSNVRDYYSLSDIFVLPTLSDASPLAPLEAMAHGCAAIISSAKYTGAAELLGPEEAIILNDPKNPEEIAAGLRALIDPAVRAELAERGRIRVKDFSWDGTAAVAEEALQRSLKEKAGR